MKPIHFRNTSGAEDAAALVQVHACCHEQDGTDPISLQEYRPSLAWYKEELDRTNAEDWIVAEQDGTVVGYGHTLWDWAEADGTRVFLHVGWVAPAWRGLGVGTELLDRLEARCREKALEVQAVCYEYGANASGREQNACLHLESNGYAPGYTIWEMERSVMLPVRVTPLPAGYELRPVAPEHYRALWQCIGDAYDVSRPNGRFQEIPTEADYENYFRDASAGQALWFVAWQGSRVVGQVLCRVREQCGEVYEVSVGFGHRHKGLARALLTRGLDALHQHGVSTVRLYTIFENPTAAWKLYEQAGFQKVGEFPRWRKPFTL